MKKTDFTLSIPLKQHTPILHFQHEQDGATLRATEVKPKLDRFIIRKMTGKEGEEAFEAMKEKYPKWLVGGMKAKHPALDYKLKIAMDEVEKDYLVGSYFSKSMLKYCDENEIEVIDKAPYFANNSLLDEKDYDKIVVNKDYEDAIRGRVMKGVVLHFFSLNIELRNEIALAIYPLMAFENFGLRQSKGFGSFFPTEIQVNNKKNNVTLKNYKDALASHIDFEGVFYFNKDMSHKPQRIFKKIDETYKKLKGGIGSTPSQIMEYFKEEEILWEKPKLKNLAKGKGFSDKNGFVTKYVRALLGLAELYEFRHDNGGKFHVKHKEEKIYRFRSPITFKVYGNKIYALGHKIPNEIFDTEFEFENKENSRKTVIKTPSKMIGGKEFNVLDFLYDEENGLSDEWYYWENSTKEN